MDVPKAKILVVDDEPNVLITVEAILAMEGYDVDAMGDPEAALEAIRTHHYDLVLTDLKMPKVDGLAILAEVRKSSPATVTIMMTGYASVDSALEAVQLGAYEYLLKPTEVAQLKLAVKRSLERKRFSEIDTLYTVSQTIASALDLDLIVAKVSDAAQRVLNLDYARLAPQGAAVTPAPDDELALLLSDSEMLRRLSNNEVITSEDNVAAARKWAARAGGRSYALVPGLVRGRLACILCTHNGEQPYEFHASACRFLTALASQTALALDNAALVAQLRRNNQELATANDKLRELDRLKSQFLSVATHELRTPLTVILGYNSMLSESMEDRLTAEEQETLRESVAACKRLIRLVNSMLDVTQIESGKMHMNMVRSDLRQLVQGTVTLFQHEARQRNLKLRAELPARLPKIEMDPERIQQVLTNLVGNALKFTPAGGQVTVAVHFRSEHQEAEVAVSDTGTGIAPQDQAHIFEEFAPVRSRPLGGRGESTGLGLAISRRILQAHQGSIRVSSVPGRGSTFTFSLPAFSRARSLENAVSA